MCNTRAAGMVRETRRAKASREDAVTAANVPRAPPLHHARAFRQIQRAILRSGLHAADTTAILRRFGCGGLYFPLRDQRRRVSSEMENIAMELTGTRERRPYMLSR